MILVTTSSYRFKTRGGGSAPRKVVEQEVFVKEKVRALKWRGARITYQSPPFD
jgi:hypothetical protein